MMKTKAAVLHQIGGQLNIEEVNIQAPKAGQLLVRILASGVCHTDETARNGLLLGADFAPAVLGHEGAGVVEQVGEGGTEFAVGDHVMITYASCGECEFCKKGQTYNCVNFVPLNFGGVQKDGSYTYTQGDQDVKNFFGMSSFGMHAVVSTNSCIKVPESADLATLAPFGCGLLTGAGTMLDYLGAKEGETAVVYGCGAVGFAGIMGARLAGCSTVIAVGGNQWKLDLAKEVGATHVINRKETPDIAAEIRKISPAGAHAHLDTSGSHEMIQAALNSLAIGGRIACVAVMKDPVISLNINNLLYTNSWIGSVMEGGSNKIERLKFLVQAYMDGKFPADKLMTYYNFEDINQAFADLNAGKVIKAVLKFPAQ